MSSLDPSTPNPSPEAAPLEGVAAPERSGGDGPVPPRRKGLGRVIHPPLWVLLLLHVIGWLLVVLGVLGLFLPILQGVLFLLAGFAVLSIASETVHAFLRRRFRGYPRAWRRLSRLRRTIVRRLPAR